MRTTTITAIAAATMLLSACGGAPPVPSVAGGGSGSGADAVPRCEDVDPVPLPEQHLRDEPVYVANEMPIEELQAWAQPRSGFEELWIDRDHHGWVVLGFSEDAAPHQAELAEAFPDVGAVAVEVPHTLDELLALQQRAHEELPDVVQGSWASVHDGVTGLEVGALTEEKVQAVAAAFAGEPVCVTGIDPATLPEAGPQPDGGDGWRLLHDEVGGDSYRTGIAADEESYARLWEEIGLDGDAPAADLRDHVVIWFGAVFSGSCPEIRLDEVVATTDTDPPLVHAVIVRTGDQMACTDDANPRAYLVEFERSRLPAAPFAIQLRGDDPPAGVPEERTLVTVDLREPGAPLPPDGAGPDPALIDASRQPPVLDEGAIIEEGYPARYRFYAHCGPEWLGPVNDTLWRSETTDTPDAWREVADDEEYVVLELLLETDPPRLTASANGADVVYEPTGEEHPGCD